MVWLGWLAGWRGWSCGSFVGCLVGWLVGCKSDAEEVVGLKYKLIGEGRKGFSWLHWTDSKRENHWGDYTHAVWLIILRKKKQKICRLFGPNCSSSSFMGFCSGISHSSKRQRTESSWMLGDSHLSGLLNEATPQQAGDTHWPFWSCEFPIEHGDFLAGFPQDFTRHDTDEDQKISEV